MKGLLTIQNRTKEKHQIISNYIDDFNLTVELLQWPPPMAANNRTR